MADASAVAALRRRLQMGATELGPKTRLRFGLESLHGQFGSSGLPLAGSHELSAAAPGENPAVTGFALALLALVLEQRPNTKAICIQETSAARECGLSYGAGLHAYGADPDRLIFVSTPNTSEALRITDEALRSGALGMVVTEVWADERKLDLAATKRFNTAAERSGTGCFLLTRSPAGTSAARTRWLISSETSAAPAPALIGAPRFDLELTRNRFGKPGRWSVEWDCHEHVFRNPADAVRLARPAGDRPPADAGDHVSQAYSSSRQVG